ncbi:Solute carrier family 26 member 9 [Bagarius yarrelli]|uniref:Solute carrier family 26 member 9 n=1 Tax=Bagarius yarrelli TaxID=175774 RepID=A0A556V2G1_BAGYA|nr:Solute carrier family 26 member 9 [Bagarius yarrelli]
MNQVCPRYSIERSAYSQSNFDVEFNRKKRNYPLREKVGNIFRCSSGRLKSLLFRHLPVLSWLPKYNFKQNLVCDVISGVSAGTIQVPQGMAFALLANLPPVNGLYSSFFPLIPYFFMGTAHQMVPGTFAVLSIMVGIVCQQLAPESHYSYFNTTLNSTVVYEQQMNEARLAISGTLACLTAIIQIGLGMLQFGFVAIYLSESFVRGFMTAAGLQILISVLKYIFGITVPPYSGPLAIIYTFIDICEGLPRTNIASLLFAIGSCLALIIVKELSTRYRHIIPFPIPIEIIVVVIATAISGPLHLPEKYHMQVVGEIPLGFPSPILPEVVEWGEMLSSAFSLAIVGYVINLAMARTLATKHGYDVDPNQEMLALGFSNFLGGFFKIHVICCALSVTLAVDSAGGSSQFASLCVMVVVMVTMLALGAFLKPLPKTKAIEGVKIVSYCSPLYFANAEIFHRKVIKKTGLDPSKMLLARKKFMENQEKKKKQEIKAKQSENKAASRDRKLSSLVTMKMQTISQIDLQSDFYTIDVGSDNMPNSFINPYCDTMNPTDQLPEPEPEISPPVMMEMQPVPFHTLILDLGGVCFIDLMGIKILTKVLEELEAGGVFDGSGFSPSQIFLSVHDAVLFAQHKSLTPTTTEQENRNRVKFAFDIEDEQDLEQVKCSKHTIFLLLTFTSVSHDLCK